MIDIVVSHRAAVPTTKSHSKSLVEKGGKVPSLDAIENHTKTSQAAYLVVYSYLWPRYICEHEPEPSTQSIRTIFLASPLVRITPAVLSRNFFSSSAITFL